MTAAQIADVLARTSSVDVTTAIATAYAASKQLDFPEGTYSVSALPNFAVFGTRIRGIGSVVINYTGSTIGLDVDAGAASTIVQNVHIENLTINATDTAATAFRIRGITHSVFKSIRMRNFTDYGLLTNFMVSNHFEDIMCTGNEPGMTTVTTTGLQLDKRGTGEQSSNCTWINVIMEGVGTGINLADAIINTFIGGTSEGNTTGVVIGVASFENSFLGIDTEVNTTDVICTGSRNKFDTCFLDGPVNITGGNGNMVTGGQVEDVTVSAGAKGTTLKDFGYTGTITDNGTDTLKSNLFVITGAAVDPLTIPVFAVPGTWVITPTGLTVVGTPTYTGTYTRLGNVIHWTAKFVSTTSTASAGPTTTYFNLPIAASAQGGSCIASSVATAAGYGTGSVAGAVCYPPSWAANADVVVSGTYLV